ncbi:MAG: hypothetical protein JSW16_01475 [Dehalococcoidales bacterium]|nr:MAG: hypothetical protein JSW16_01475 [Dehalococcoidales bacterium]
MINNIINYLQRRRKTKLYRQWVQQSSLSADDVPDELVRREREGADQPSDEESDFLFEEMPRQRIPVNTRWQVSSSGIFIPTRYILLTGSAILLLLVIVSVLSTVLIMRSC